ncbi:hypothetical protein CEXT_283731 [Caerostris extrusa]|uniref:Uncharacterized protein n=1 Tax=Caerostris extrusa TaxID=172846 RepID=A0AAV4QZ90_CAEEX|nr:hypothetical protein CEXT_283731 [Caerostris extrusa]
MSHSGVSNYVCQIPLLVREEHTWEVIHWLGGCRHRLRLSLQDPLLDTTHSHTVYKRPGTDFGISLTALSRESSISWLFEHSTDCSISLTLAKIFHSATLNNLV